MKTKRRSTKASPQLKSHERQLALKERRLLSTRDLLLLVGLDVPLMDIRSWSGLQHNQAAVWASAVHARASDNPIRVPSKPGFLKRYKEQPVTDIDNTECIVCGCTELDACPGGCSWIEPGICSAPSCVILVRLLIALKNLLDFPHSKKAVVAALCTRRDAYKFLYKEAA